MKQKIISGVVVLITSVLLGGGTVFAQALPTSAQLTQTVRDATQQGKQALLPIPAASEQETAHIGEAPYTIVDGKITAAIQAAINNPAIKLIELPAGTYKIGMVNLDKASGKVIRGKGTETILQYDRSQITYNGSQSRPAFLATSGAGVARVLFTEFILDMNWQPGTPAEHAFQLTNVDTAQFYKMAIKNVGQAGIVAQGFGGTGKGSPNLLVLDTAIEATGLVDAQTGFGILVKDASPRAVIIGNKITGIKGGMGIGAHATTIGAPTDMVIVDNFIAMAPSTTSYEGIGLTRGADRAIVARNVIDPSFDNGLSLSSSDNLAIQNYTSSAWNHGLAIEAMGSIWVANEIGLIGLRNAALGEKLEYGAITLVDGGNNLVSGNVIRGGDMAFAVKFNGSQLGGNLIGHNEIVGAKALYNRPPLASDITDDRVPVFTVPLLTPEERRTAARWAGPTAPVVPGGVLPVGPVASAAPNSAAVTPDEKAPATPNTGYQRRGTWYGALAILLGSIFVAAGVVLRTRL